MKVYQLSHPGAHSDLVDSQILDVRLEDDFEAGHLARAQSNCVFEVSFGERLETTAPNRDLPTVVYGADGETHEAEAAAEKLWRLGYRDVRILEGGLVAARQAGLEIEAGTPLPEPPPEPQGKLEIDLEESRLEWLGRNLINKHWGTAALESGFLEFEDGQLTGGSFVIDLQKLKCTDLAGSDLHDVLISHLQSDDFFDVENHPKATFTITKVDVPEGTTPGSTTHRVTGDLTLRGQTHAIEFEVSAGRTPEGKMAAQAAFSIDRTKWGVIYGSGKFFSRIAGHLVNDFLEFQLRVLTR